MAEWSQLPKDLLNLIAKHLPTETDLLRFRSVCSSFRSSITTADLRPTPPRFPILPNQGIFDTSWGFYLSKRTIFLLGLPQPHPQTPWLIKIEQDSPHKTHLLNPLTRFEFKPLPESFPKILDLLNFRVYELGHEYILQHINYRPFANSISDAGNLYMEKVALRSVGIERYVLLTIHVSGRLALFKSGDSKWTIVSDDFLCLYDDVIVFNGDFYAVDGTGRSVIVNHIDDDDDVVVLDLVADSVFGGDKKVLVESCGELLLVDTYLSGGVEEEEEDVSFDEQFDGDTRTVRFKVFGLDRREKKWVEVMSLGDRMLFLGENCSFSASASDFFGCKGNCIFFTDHYFHLTREEDGGLKSCVIGVFDLESGSIGSLSNYPGYYKMFWPPPTWVSSTMLEDGLNQLGI